MMEQEANIARQLEEAIGNVIAEAPEPARPFLVVWKNMAHRAAEQLDKERKENR